ncbi:MAG: hypothetical protein ACR2M7_03630 [Bdellovibrionales bacterium]
MLRSIPNKLGGVVALFSSVLLLIVLPFTFLNLTRRTTFYPLRQSIFWGFVAIMLILT